MLIKSIVTGGAALAFLAGGAVASAQSGVGGKSENTVQVATYRVSDGDQEVRIIIKDGRPEIYLNGKRVDPKQVESKDGLWRIRGQDGQTRARFFMAPREGGNMTLRFEGDDERVVELNRLLERAPQAPDAPRAVVQRRPILGVTLESLDEAVASQLKVDADRSILVVGVAPGSGAEEAGIQAQDIIVGIADKDRGDLETIRAALADKQAGDEVKVVVLRAGDKKTAVVRLKPVEGVVASPVPEAFMREFEEASRWGRGVEGEPEARARVRVGEAPQADIRERVLRERERTATVRQRVDELQRRMHEKQQVQHEQQADQHRRMVIELDKHRDLARNLDGLRKMHVEIDAETRKQIEEAMTRAAEAMEEIEIDFELPEIEILGEGKGGRVLFLPEPPNAEAFGHAFRFRAAPRAPDAPRAPRAAGRAGQAMFYTDAGADRLARIEERLARIEGILTGMAGGMGAKGRSCDCDCCDND